jgi:uncharacterized protein (TIGR04222 family)
MNWLTHNPIADLPLPQFLLVYSAIAIAVITAAYGAVRLLDRTDWGKPPRVPGTFDPCEMAYLRGGTNAVICTVLYGVYRRGLVLTPPVSWFRASRIVAKDDLSGRTLTGLEERILKALRRPAVPSRLFRNRSLRRGVKRLCRPFRNKLRSERLLRSGAARVAIGLVPPAATAILIALAVHKAVLAAPKGRPDSLLILTAAVALVVLWSLVGPHARMRVSHRGDAYLQRTQEAYQHSDMSGTEMVGLFGMGMLRRTSDAWFASLLLKGARDGQRAG